MIYSKLPAVLLNSIAAEKADSTNSILARWLLEHQNEMKDLTIKDVAAGAHTGIASVSRFVRDLGFEDFKELKQLLMDGMDPFERTEGTGKDIPVSYLSSIQQGLQKACAGLDYEALQKCVRIIEAKQNIWIFSLLKGQAAAIALAADLTMLGKNARTLFSYKEQMEVLKKSTEKDLILLFSYTGSYFAYEERIPDKKEFAAPVVMICSGDHPCIGPVDLVVPFDSLQSQLDHPYTMIYIAGVIAQMYAEKISEAECSHKIQ